MVNNTTKPEQLTCIVNDLVIFQIQIVYLTQTCIFLRHKKITLIIICLYMYMSWRSSEGYVAASARPPLLGYTSTIVCLCSDVGEASD